MFLGLRAKSTNRPREYPCDSVAGTVKIVFGTSGGMSALSSSSVG